MTETLEKYGFVYHHGCHCGGVLKKYYRREAYELMITPSRKKWKIRLSGRTVADGWDSELEQKLKEIYDKKAD